jgi:hypothetical protein
MSIDKSGKWWIGSEPNDIKEYLEAYASEGYEADEFRLSNCNCGSKIFYLYSDDDEGVAKRVCVDCGAEHFICDSEEFWDEAKPKEHTCIECKSNGANIGVAFSLYENRDGIKWLYIGYRCNDCGVLGCCAGWKIGESGSNFLMERV